MFITINKVLILATLCIFISLFDQSNARLNHLLSQKNGKLGEPEGHIDFKSLPPEKWFNQKLDHFDVTEPRTWKQRYFINSTWYKSNGPAFLMVGGEGAISAKWMVQGAWLDYAQKHKALCFQLEHRFYGKSHPFSDLSLKSLQYLSSEQALADLAYFIVSMNKEHSLAKNVKWIVFGGSYPGSLAAWLRYKYPHLVEGAVSASGPLQAVVDFNQYYQVVADALRTVNPNCTTYVQNATSAVTDLLTKANSYQYLTETFKLCDPLSADSSHKDKSSFVESLADNFAGVVQYNKDNRDGSKNITIDTLCKIMLNPTKPPIERYADVNSLMLFSQKKSCLDYKYDKMINDMKNESFASEMAEGGRQWMYQTCSEFGFYQSSSQKSHIFGQEFPVDFFTDQCKDIYGPKFPAKFIQESVDRTNMMYGALNLGVSKVVFVHGSIDPWHALGITSSKSTSFSTIYIQGTAHCANMYPPSVNDLPDLTKARLRINHLIGNWLKDKAKSVSNDDDTDSVTSETKSPDNDNIGVDNNEPYNPISPNSYYLDQYSENSFYDKNGIIEINIDEEGNTISKDNNEMEEDDDDILNAAYQFSYEDLKQLEESTKSKSNILRNVNDNINHYDKYITITNEYNDPIVEQLDESDETLNDGNQNEGNVLKKNAVFNIIRNYLNIFKFLDRFNNTNHSK